jgi:hypothetical protein
MFYTRVRAPDYLPLPSHRKLDRRVPRVLRISASLVTANFRLSPWRWRDMPFFGRMIELSATGCAAPPNADTLCIFDELSSSPPRYRYNYCRCKIGICNRPGETPGGTGAAVSGSGDGCQMEREPNHRGVKNGLCRYHPSGFPSGSSG